MAKQKKVKKKQAERHTRKIACSGADRFFFYLWQFTWGLPVNIFGFIAYLIMYKGHRHEKFCNAFITYVPKNFGGVSLGLFIFIREGGSDEWTHDTRIHEYGHTLQCLLLGPLYWLVIGLPSATWCNFPYFVKMRKEKNVSYYSLYCESWANAWGQKCSGYKQFNMK